MVIECTGTYPIKWSADILIIFIEIPLETYPGITMVNDVTYTSIEFSVYKEQLFYVYHYYGTDMLKLLSNVLFLATQVIHTMKEDRCSVKG